MHVDFTIGTSSVLSTSTNLKAGQQVVVDGQEKLVDGAPVTPSQAHTVPAINNGGAVGATNPSAATAPPAAGSGGLTPARPFPPDAVEQLSRQRTLRPQQPDTAIRTADSRRPPVEARH